MGVIETRTFKSGNSVAVRLPRDLGFAEGVAVRIERVGDHVEIRAAADPAEEKRKLTELVAALHALTPVSEPGRREPIDWPDRAE